MHQIGTLEHQAFNLRETFCTATFYHVSGQGPRATRKSNQWNTSIELSAYSAYRIHDILEFILWIRYGEVLNRFLVLDWPFKLWTFTLGKIEPQPHSIRNG